jgi:hypothetical protein
LWSAKDYGNFVDLAAPSPPPAPKKAEEDWEFSGVGDGADNLPQIEEGVPDAPIVHCRRQYLHLFERRR